ncbi:MAG: hypothetical protein L0027_10270 [Candidatus Rokubacteria bacterium]|nr:hypothetical protein [Candidatus Rokubacteria bacterium]
MTEVRLVAEAADAGAKAGAEGDTTLDGGTDEAGQDRGGLGEWVGRRRVVVGASWRRARSRPTRARDR